MKINELVKEVNSYFLNLKAIRRDDGVLIISGNDDALLLVPEKATNFMEVYFCIDNQGMYFTKANREKLSALIEEFLHTPIKERFPEKKYRVRLIGFNSDNGSQYLTTEGDSLNDKFFACALRSDLKQEFTMNEINQLANSTQFRAVPWFQDLMRNIEPVEGD